MNKRWPLRCQPYDDQLLSDWIRDLAKIYETSYLNFCYKVLMLTSDEINNLCYEVPRRALIILSNSTGIAIDKLEGRDMSSRYKKWEKEYRENQARENQEITSI